MKITLLTVVLEILTLTYMMKTWKKKDNQMSLSKKKKKKEAGVVGVLGVL